MALNVEFGAPFGQAVVRIPVNTNARDVNILLTQLTRVPVFIQIWQLRRRPFKCHCIFIFFLCKGKKMWQAIKELQREKYVESEKKRLSFFFYDRKLRQQRRQQ